MNSLIVISICTILIIFVASLGFTAIVRGTKFKKKNSKFKNKL